MQAAVEAEACAKHVPSKCYLSRSASPRFLININEGPVSTHLEGRLKLTRSFLSQLLRTLHFVTADLSWLLVKTRSSQRAVEPHTQQGPVDSTGVLSESFPFHYLFLELNRFPSLLQHILLYSHGLSLGHENVVSGLSMFTRPLLLFSPLH